MKNKKVLIVLLVVVALGGLGVFVYANLNQGEDLGLEVAVATVGRSTLESTITAQGEVFLLESEVAFITNTLEVSEVLVRENYVVEEGQPLIIFNTDMQERERERERLVHQLRDTQLTLRSQEVSLESLRIGPTALEIENAGFNINRANQGILDAGFALEQVDSNIATQQRALELIFSNLADAELTLSNTLILLDVGAATQNQVDAAQRAVENLQTEVFNAQERLATLDGQRTQSLQNITAAEDNLRMAQVQLEDMENRINSPHNANAISQQEIGIQRTRLAIGEIQRNINILDDVEEVLYSPISGTITRINVVRGGIATQGAPLVEISDAGAYVLRAFVNERNAGQLNIGQAVAIEGSILGNEILQGRISSISTVATTTQIAGVMERVIPIEITVDEEDTPLLIPGVTLDVTVTTNVRENVIAIPILSTLSEPDGGNFVFVVNSGNTLSRRDIDILAHADMYIEVTGLSEGEVIVLQPQHFMADEMMVNPIS